MVGLACNTLQMILLVFQLIGSVDQVLQLCRVRQSSNGYQWPVVPLLKWTEVRWIEGLISVFEVVDFGKCIGTRLDYTIQTCWVDTSILPFEPLKVRSKHRGKDLSSKVQTAGPPKDFSKDVPELWAIT